VDGVTYLVVPNTWLSGIGQLNAIRLE
jgi:hypothetical protein